MSYHIEVGWIGLEYFDKPELRMLVGHKLVEVVKRDNLLEEVRKLELGMLAHKLLVVVRMLVVVVEEHMLVVHRLEPRMQVEHKLVEVVEQDNP